MRIHAAERLHQAFPASAVLVTQRFAVSLQKLLLLPVERPDQAAPIRKEVRMGR
jgi:hypothetical protein